MIKFSLCSLGSRLFFTRELDDEDCGNVQWGDSDNFVDDIDECKYVAKQIGDSFRNVSNDMWLPKGCIRMSTGIYFNRHPRGRHRKHASQLCKKS